MIILFYFNRRDDALRSAKLAVNIAHERLDRANKVYYSNYLNLFFCSFLIELLILL